MQQIIDYDYMIENKVSYEKKAAVPTKPTHLESYICVLTNKLPTK